LIKPPLCPLTGLPAEHLIQRVSARLLTDLWRASFGVKVAGQFAGVRWFHLWRSPCGLAFFDPPVVGDDGFYAELHDAVKDRYDATRSEFAPASRLVPPRATVLDVGCGSAAFAPYVGHARYTGLDPHGATYNAAAKIVIETAGAHADRLGAAYDVVCSFQVLEHVPDPRRFAGDLVRCLKPGGRLLLGVPRWPSAITVIPNFVLNAPPHHLTWWTEPALRALAEKVGLEVEQVEHLPCPPDNAILYWMARAAPKITGTRYFSGHWSWAAALIWSWIAGRVCSAVRRAPTAGEPLDMLLVARKPG